MPLSRRGADDLRGRANIAENRTHVSERGVVLGVGECRATVSYENHFVVHHHGVAGQIAATLVAVPVMISVSIPRACKMP